MPIKPLTPHTGGSLYDPDAGIFFNQVLANSIIVYGDGRAALSVQRKLQWNIWFISAKSNGYFSELDRFHSLFAENEIEARTSAVNPSQPMITYGNSPTFTTFYGIKTNGTNNYIKTGFTPSINGSKYLLNSAFAGLGIVENTNGTGVEMAVSDGTNQLEIATCYSGVYYSDVNDATNSTQSNTSNLDADYIAIRTANNVLSSYKNNTPNSTATNSTALPTKEVFLGAYNDNGTADTFKAGVYTWFGFGSKNINVANFRTDLAALQTPQNRSIILIIDQSNSTGQAAAHNYANLPSQYKPIMQNAYAIGSGEGLYNYDAGFNSIHGDTSGSSFEWTASAAYNIAGAGKHPVIVNLSIGNTSLYSPAIGTGTWDYTQAGNLFTSQMNTLFYPTLNRLKGQTDLIVVIGLLENDASTSASANAHQANKLALINHVRDTVVNGGTGFASCKIGLMKLSPSANMTYKATVNTAVDNLLANDPTLFLCDENTATLQSDMIHFTDAYAVQFGSDKGNLIAPLIQY